MTGPLSPARPATDARLRRAVLDHVTSESRRVFPLVVHVGSPGAPTLELVLDEARPDHALCVDVVTALVHRARRELGPASPLVWTTRPGSLVVQDRDLTWSGATHAAAQELGTTLAMVVVTRQGWCDPRTGATRAWRRLRPVR